LSFIGILLGFALVVQNNTRKYHEAQLFQYIICKKTDAWTFARGSMEQYFYPDAIFKPENAEFF
jgi:hypothetical protein